MKENMFIRRPVFAICISIGIVFLGLLALQSLSIEKFPDIAPPTVHVSATYMGASAEMVQNAVIVPLEESINGVENMTYMESTASSGSASINIYFKQGTDPDQASVNVQNRVSEAQGQLPSEVTQIGVTVQKRQTSTLAFVGIYSPDDSFDESFITNYININIAPQIQRIEGVGEVNTMGRLTVSAFGSIRRLWHITGWCLRTSLPCSMSRTLRRPWGPLERILIMYLLIP